MKASGTSLALLYYGSYMHVFDNGSLTNKWCYIWHWSEVSILKMWSVFGNTLQGFQDHEWDKLALAFGS